YKYPFRRGRLWLQPQAMLGFRDANLNNYYYGVRPGEATPLRPAYSAGGGALAQLGLYGAYRLTERWRLIGGVTWVRWPDFVGLARHKEAGFQPDFYQINAYIKAYYYGFPWDSHVRTRVGLGIGLAYARRIPLMEVRDLADRGRPTSRLLNTFDPTVDVSVG